MKSLGISTMPRKQSEADQQLELYKLITEKQRIQEKLEMMERQISRSCAKRPHLSRNTGTPQRLDRKKVKYTCSPSRCTPNSKLK